MSEIFYFIDRISIGIYILIAVVILWMLRRWLREQSQFRSTFFELERDLSRNKQANVITTIIILIQFALILVGIQRSVVPVLAAVDAFNERAAEIQVIQDGTFNTPTPAPLSGEFDVQPVEDLGGDNDFNQILITPLPTPTLVGTIIANAPEPFGCSSTEASLEIPANGMRVFEPIVVRGTAFTENFAYAKIELKGPGTFNNFTVIDDKREPIAETADFSQFVPAPYEPGRYEFRLMVFDITDTLRASCLVNIYINRPAQTPSPTAPGSGV